jgi:hypothetical protein
VSAAVSGWDRDARTQNRRAWEYATEPPRTPPPDEGKRDDARTDPGPPAESHICTGDALPPRGVPDGAPSGENQLLEKGR